MRILISPDSFRGVMTGAQVASAIEEGLSRIMPDSECVLQLVADGGEGTVDILVKYFHGMIQSSYVTGLLGQPIKASWGLIENGKTAVIEISAASGVETVAKPLLDPMLSTSYGTGELIREALDYGCTRILLGLGGSGTVDGGLGLLEALGYRFLDIAGKALPRGGIALSHLAAIDVSNVHPRIAEVEFIVLCDIDTPIFFNNSSIAKMFGPQKGADPASIRLLDNGLQKLIKAVEQYAGVNIGYSLFDGASGAAAGAMRGIVGASLVSGIETLLNLIQFDGLVDSAEFVVTGEGRIDRQTLRGKAPLGVIHVAQKHGKPVACITGQVTDNISTHQLGCIEPIWELSPYGAISLEYDVVWSRLVTTAKLLGKQMLNDQSRSIAYE